MKYLGYFLVFFVASMVVVTIVVLFVPSYPKGLFIEDGPIETLSAVVYLCACLYSVFVLIKLRKYRFGLFIVGILGLICFFEELSYGERMFGLSMPYIYDVKIDALHDFLRVIRREMSQYEKVWPFVKLAVVTCAGLSIIPVVIYRRNLAKLLSRLFGSRSFVFPVITIVLILTSQFMDMGVWKHILSEIYEEVIEFSAAVALLFYPVSLYRIQTGLAAQSKDVPLVGGS